MKYVSKFLSVNPEKKIQKLQNEIIGIEHYCAFMTSLEGVHYDTSVLMERKIECKRKIVRIKTISESKTR